jgi:hypothetical protein
MTPGTVHHIADEELRAPASYLTVRCGDRVYDLYGWAAGKVVEPRIAHTRDEFFDGLLIDFRDRRVFVDAPEVRAIHPGVVVLTLTVADLTGAVRDPSTPAAWPDGPPHAPTRGTEGAAAADDAVALMAALSRMYVAGRLTLDDLERDVERVLAAETCAELDAIATELLPPPVSDPLYRP